MGANKRDLEQVDGALEFRRIFDRYHRPIFNFFANRGLAVEDCHELTQETFLGAYAGRERFRGDAGVATWLFSIAKNVWRQALRDRHRLKRQAEEVPFDELSTEPAPGAASGEPAAGALERVLVAEQVRLMREALDKLPELMHACTVMRIDQGLSYRQIAAALRISVEQVKSQLFQARGKLKRLLAERFEEIEV